MKKELYEYYVEFHGIKNPFNSDRFEEVLQRGLSPQEVLSGGRIMVTTPEEKYGTLLRLVLYLYANQDLHMGEILFLREFMDSLSGSDLWLLIGGINHLCVWGTRGSNIVGYWSRHRRSFSRIWHQSEGRNNGQIFSKAEVLEVLV